MIVFTVDEPVFRTATQFVLGADHDQFARWLKRTHPRVSIETPDVDYHVGTMYTFKGPPWRMVWTSTLALPTIIHEVFHLVTRICDDKGIVIRAHLPGTGGECGDETAAYLMEYFMAQVVKRVRVQVGGRRRKGRQRQRPRRRKGRRR